MIKTVIAAVSGALIAVATPAFADVAKPMSDASAEVSTAPAATAAPKSAVKPTRYCIKETITGSRLPTRVCNTREDWLAQGFDPLAK
ncbi:hypothetical protein [Sphingomonas sp. GB1N7]|uniref:hypothetical protein n=1 Tax=Parasphingomonas caseinilytica TaxID=3096158 RepID=UPI002FCAE891